MEKEGKVEIINALFDKLSISSVEIARLIGYVEALDDSFNPANPIHPYNPV